MHLEEELRRTLLKGISAMNLEALSIFQSAATTDSARAGPTGLEPPPPRSDFASGSVSSAASAAFGATGHHQHHTAAATLLRTSGEARTGGAGAAGVGFAGAPPGSPGSEVPRPRAAAPKPMVERHGVRSRGGY